MTELLVFAAGVALGGIGGFVGAYFVVKKNPTLPSQVSSTVGKL